MRVCPPASAMKFKHVVIQSLAAVEPPIRVTSQEIERQLKPTLDRLVDAALAVPSLDGLSQARAVALVYQLLGAAHYFAISQPTLTHIFGVQTLATARRHFEDELRVLVVSRLGCAAA